MKRYRTVAVALIALSIIVTAGVVSGAMVDYFLKLDGIPGESLDAKHKGEIEVLTWSWGETNTGTAGAGGGMGAGKVQFQDFIFTAKVNNTSVKLLSVCATGSHIKSAVLTCRKAGKEQQEFYKINFSDILVSSYSTEAAGSGDFIPIDRVKLNASRVEFIYDQKKPDGSSAGQIKGGFDLKTMRQF